MISGYSRSNGSRSNGQHGERSAGSRRPARLRATLALARRARGCDNAVMTGHYLDVLTLRLRGYEGEPEPGSLAAALSVTVIVGGLLDLDELVDEIREDLAGRSRRIQQTYGETSWAGSGTSSGALLVVDMPAEAAGGAEGLVPLWEAICLRVLGHGQARPGDGAAADSARLLAARCLQASVDGIGTSGLEPAPDGCRVRLQTPHGPFHGRYRR